MPLTSGALTTWATAQAEMGIASGQRSVIERMINAISAAMSQAALGRTFEFKSGIIETVNGLGGFHLVLDRAPIKRVASVSLLNPDGSIAYTYDQSTYTVENAGAGILYRTSGAYGLASGYSTGATGVYGRMMGWPNLAQPADDIRGSPQPTTERPAIQVVYDAGWITPAQDVDAGGNTVGLRDLPYDLEEACLIGVETIYARRGRSRDISSETTQASSISYRLPDTEYGILPPEVAKVAKNYARPR